MVILTFFTLTHIVKTEKQSSSLKPIDLESLYLVSSITWWTALTYAQIMALGPNMTHLVGHQERGQFPIDIYIDKTFKSNSGERSRVTCPSS